jgi:hypothetical protein
MHNLYLQLTTHIDPATQMTSKLAMFVVMLVGDGPDPVCKSGTSSYLYRYLPIRVWSEDRVVVLD